MDVKGWILKDGLSTDWIQIEIDWKSNWQMSQYPPPQRGRSKTKGTSTPTLGKSPSKSRSTSPIVPGKSADEASKEKLERIFMWLLAKDLDDEDQKSIKIPAFSDGTDWESVVFDLEVNLEKVWKFKSKMDDVEYLQGMPQTCDPKYVLKADKMIYYALITAAKRDSFARNQIMASRHLDANPRVDRERSYYGCGRQGQGRAWCCPPLLWRASSGARLSLRWWKPEGINGGGGGSGDTTPTSSSHGQDSSLHA